MWNNIYLSNKEWQYTRTSHEKDKRLIYAWFMHKCRMLFLLSSCYSVCGTTYIYRTKNGNIHEHHIFYVAKQCLSSSAVSTWLSLNSTSTAATKWEHGARQDLLINAHRSRDFNWHIFRSISPSLWAVVKCDGWWQPSPLCSPMCG